MRSLISIHSLSKSFGTQQLFENITFSVQEGDHIGLLGPNGSGKSTLLKIMLEMESADAGSISRKKGVRVGYACQEPVFSDQPLLDVLLPETLLGDPIELRTRAQTLLSKMQFANPQHLASMLSGGWKKRLDIARALMHEPDILLLDEPTNHLDLEGILWLEKFLKGENIAYVIVSHDRYFLENVCNKIIELNRCYPQGLFICEGGMSSFAQQREAFLEVQKQRERGLASIVRDEVAWLKKSPSARTTKSRSRIQRAHELMEELSSVQQRNKSIKVDVNFVASERETRRLLVAKNLGKKFGENTLFNGLDLTLSPGNRLGITGKNGTGKTTLLKLLAGTITPDKGTIKYADDLKIVYFDQHRAHLPPHLTIREALSPLGDIVNYRGQEIHVNGWAKKFLFPTERLSLPIGYLSGGERARILIAKLMLEPADLLFLDEPTNDLDIQTLEVIEESLMDFKGSVILISHDRCLMDNVCTQILGLEGDGQHHFFADYNQWEKSQTAKNSPKKTQNSSSATSQRISSTSKKLSYKEQKELDGMEGAIMECENTIKALKAELESLTTSSDAQKSLELYQKLADAEEKLEHLFDRWQTLEQLGKIN